MREKLGGQHHDGGWLARYDSYGPSSSMSSPASPKPPSSSSSLATAAASSAAAATNAFLSISLPKLSRSHSSNNSNKSSNGGLSSSDSSTRRNLSLPAADSAHSRPIDHHDTSASPSATLPTTSSDYGTEVEEVETGDPLETLRADLLSLDAINRTDAVHFQRRIEHTESLLASSSQALDTASKWEIGCAIEVQALKQTHQECMQSVQIAHLNLRRNSRADGGINPNANNGAQISSISTGMSSSNDRASPRNAPTSGVTPSNAQRIWLNRVTREVEQLKRKPPQGIELLLEDDEVLDQQDHLEQHGGAAEDGAKSSNVSIIEGGSLDGGAGGLEVKKPVAPSFGSIDPIRCTCTVKLRCSYTVPDCSSPSNEDNTEVSNRMDSSAGGGNLSQSSRAFVLLLDLSKASRYVRVLI